MKILKGMFILPVLVLSMALVQNSPAPAQTLQVLTAGSSAQFGPFAVAAWELATAGGQTAFHYTFKSGAPCPFATGNTCYAALNDSRKVGTNAVPQEPGNMWIVWSNNGIWAYVVVDSTVGIRTFSAVPRATLTLAPQASLPAAGATVFTYWPDNGANDTALTTAVYNALNGHALTAANTDIRPEDGLYATNRLLNVLGYGSVADPRTGHSGQFLIGNPIKSFYTAGIANPISFALGGSVDPMSGMTGPAIMTIPIGAAPIVFVVNTLTGSHDSAGTNITSANAGLLFSGAASTGGGKVPCDASFVVGATGPVSPVLREGLSGTMNTTEFSIFRAGDPSGSNSQENGINPNATGGNPTDLACGTAGATRTRSVGNGDEINAVIGHASTIGYGFFSYEGTAGGKTDRYLELDGVDVLGTSPSYTGTLPTCPIVNHQFSCPIANGKSFPHLRDGSYHGWSIYRILTDSTNLTTTQKLVTQAQLSVNGNVPDFVPFIPVCGTAVGTTNDPGLDVYREHFAFLANTATNPATTPDTVTITPNDGGLGTTVTCKVVKGTYPALTLGGSTEDGGDVGGLIQGPFTANPPTPGPTESAPH